jgi:hypothetical protein
MRRARLAVGMCVVLGLLLFVGAPRNARGDAGYVDDGNCRIYSNSLYCCFTNYGCSCTDVGPSDPIRCPHVGGLLD